MGEATKDCACRMYVPLKKEKIKKNLFLILVQQAHKTWESIHIDKRTSIMQMKIATL